MAGKRKAGTTGAPRGNQGHAARRDDRTKMVVRLDPNVARLYKAHCVMTGRDVHRALETILQKYLAGSYWVEKSQGSAVQAGTAGEPPRPETAPADPPRS